jgi:hypothetical protein
VIAWADKTLAQATCSTQTLNHGEKGEHGGARRKPNPIK